MKQRTSEQLYNAYIRLVELSQGGNVELWNRKMISGSRMQEAGWTEVPEDTYATVYSSTISNVSETVVMNFTPILENGEILSPNYFFNYCQSVVDGRDDTLGIKIGATFNNVDDAVDAAEEAHEVSEVFYELRDAPKEEIAALDFIILKERIKSECARRKYNGSVASFADSTYDYTVVPTEGSVPLPEHFNKIIVPMNAIYDTGRTQTKSGFLVRQLYPIGEILSELEDVGITDANSGCNSSCTGLCQGTCTIGCTGCTGGCTGNCGSGCANGCSTGCLNLCTGSCEGSCVTGCGEYCEGACTNTCLSGCYNVCKGSCKGAVSSNPT